VTVLILEANGGWTLSQSVLTEAVLGKVSFSADTFQVPTSQTK